MVFNRGKVAWFGFAWLPVECEMFKFTFKCCTRDYPRALDNMCTYHKLLQHFQVTWLHLV